MINNSNAVEEKETLTVIVIMALFLLLTAACIGLRSEHLLMAALYLVFLFLPDYLPGSWQWFKCLSPFSGSRMTDAYLPQLRSKSD